MKKKTSLLRSSIRPYPTATISKKSLSFLTFFVHKRSFRVSILPFSSSFMSLPPPQIPSKEKQGRPKNQKTTIPNGQQKKNV